MLDSCKTVEKQSEAFPTFLLHFSKFEAEFYCLSFFLTSSCDNQVLVGCIPIASVAVHLNLKSEKMFSHLS